MSRNLVSQMCDRASQIPHQQHNFADVNIAGKSIVIYDMTWEAPGPPLSLSL